MADQPPPNQSDFGPRTPAKYGVKPAAPTAPAGPPGGAFGPQALAFYQKMAGNQAFDNAFGPSTMPNYTGAFQQAINAARGNINQSLQTSLADIANSQQHAQTALGTLPGQVNANYGEATGTISNALAEMAGAQKKSGMTPLMDTSAFLAPERSALANSKGADLAEVPLLQQGIGQQVDRERAQANLAAQDRMGQLDMQQAQFQQAMQMQAMQNQQQAAMARYGQETSKDTAGENFMYQTKLNDQQNKAQADLYAKQQEHNSSPAGGPYAAYGLTQGKVDAARKDPRYARFSSFILSGVADPNQVRNELANNPDLLDVLTAEHATFFSGKSKKQNVQQTPNALSAGAGSGRAHAGPSSFAEYRQATNRLG